MPLSIPFVFEHFIAGITKQISLLEAFLENFFEKKTISEQLWGPF